MMRAFRSVFTVVEGRFVIALCVVLLVLVTVGCKKESLPTEANNKNTVEGNKDTSKDWKCIVSMSLGGDESFERYLIAAKILSDHDIEYSGDGNISVAIYVKKSDADRAVKLLKSSKELDGYLFWQ